MVVVRSNIVGLPLPIYLLLQREKYDATVNPVHAFEKDPEHITREADIVVAAAGDSSCEHGYRLVGDVCCYEEALGVASAITPVPGGVRPHDEYFGGCQADILISICS
ncbi:hypothetical protein Bca4012_017927 [Brassica carinata]|uniref:Tetrahydrofolate dehydrogenase/cyclohydrolase NAD(P)-binding domain-containing protein n=1 Tax=Brassica carinata TaxID=52824 RepID=A0A8X8BG05_BRACI|nr:hypothetical protein Bca52824_003667 [Brassica carinata]